ncbi:MAG: substrate-binding domain-containing protein [Bacteroidales bacterium]|nr:substrate-binding domain-containing protein [Bacteroidales bacterium]
MNIKNFITVIIIGISIIFFNNCKNKNKQEQTTESGELKGKISISGAFALYPMAVKWAEEFKKIHPLVEIDISAGGAGKGMTDALSKMIDLGMVSRAVSPEETAKGAWKIAVTKDAVLPTINSANPYIKYIKTSGLTREQFSGLFVTGKIKYWTELYPQIDKKQKHQVNVYTRSDACGAAEMWAKYLDKKQEDLLGTGVFGDPGIADAVKKDIYGIGYNNVIYAYDIRSRKTYEGMDIIPIDMNANGKIDEQENFYNSLDSVMLAIQQNRYPSPPARELYFVSKGKPENKIVIEFLKWILNDGQKYVKEGGYVNLSDDIIKTQLEEL